LITTTDPIDNHNGLVLKFSYKFEGDEEWKSENNQTWNRRNNK
jgi:hypothetical protein